MPTKINYSDPDFFGSQTAKNVALVLEIAKDVALGL
jgi:hypothetical protein